MIYTLEARGNVLLPVMVKTFNLSNEQCSKVIQDEFAELKRKLLLKSIDYTKLKSALIPVHKDKKEIAFVFDSSLIESAWYGNTVFQCILPALNKESTYSILCGDIIADSLSKDIAEKAILGTLIQFHETVFRHPTQYYVVYINKNRLILYQPVFAVMNIR